LVKNIISNSPDELLERLTSYFDSAKKKPAKGKFGYPEYRVHCPLHADRTASLDITIGRNGQAILRCHAECSNDAILGAVGLSYKDLYVGSANPIKRRLMPLRECFEKASILLLTLHLYGRDVIAGTAINQTAFRARLTDLSNLALIIDYQDWGQYILDLHELAKHIPSGWSPALAQIFFNEYLVLVREREQLFRA